MTKLIQLRVVLAIDDNVDLKDVKTRLHTAIITKETENLSETDGELQRIHWGTADVLQGPERVPGRARTSRAASKETTT